MSILATTFHRSSRIPGEAARRYVDEWTMAITDVTEMFRNLANEVERGNLDEARAAVPDEHAYPLPEGLIDTSLMGSLRVSRWVDTFARIGYLECCDNEDRPQYRSRPRGLGLGRPGHDRHNGHDRRGVAQRGRSRCTGTAPAAGSFARARGSVCDPHGLALDLWPRI
jgi:Domain of unknown function (DUF4291)